MDKKRYVKPEIVAEREIEAIAGMCTGDEVRVREAGDRPMT